MTVLVPILGDQLTPALSSLRAIDRNDAVILMMEVADETRYVPHHPKKITLILSAMRHFSAELQADGWTVDYVTLDDPANSGSFTGEVERALARHAIDAISVTEAGEWRVQQMLRGWEGQFGLPVTIHEDDRFLCSHARFNSWANSRNSLRMEYFYRMMRQQTGLLMDGDDPAGGQWNYDADNRKAPARDVSPPQRRGFAPDAITQAVIDLVAARFDDYAGTIDGFDLGVTRADACAAFEAFVRDALPCFGDYQDAMLTGEPLLYHAFISPYLNIGLLDPMDVCTRVEAEYRAGRVPINAAEGFIRQILGWREYVRGIYWREMPDYATRNALGATRDLPGFYWSGKTDMACIAAAIGQTRDLAYAHHIQRLMVTGNFALLIGVEPRQIHEWYLSVYADAFEWVELPNTLGMSQFADGGMLASKPYASSGAYIDRMSDYCSTCRYKVKEKAGPNACPFNYLYWDFIARHQKRFAGNPRMAMIVRSYQGFSDARKREIADDAERFLDAL